MNIKMECESEKLIFLIENRPPIYDFHLKEHNSRGLLDKLWEEIADEMNCTVDECKNKWSNLRNSYARALRQRKSMSSDPRARKRKEWYLENAMSFMENYMTQHRVSGTKTRDIQNIKTDTMDVPSSENEGFIIGENQFEMNMNSSPINEKPKFTTPINDKFMEPIIPFSHTRTHIMENEDDPYLMFMKSLLPDLRKLSEKRQRLFKQNMLINLNELLEEQENETK